MAYQLTEQEKQFINQGGVISEPGTEKQTAYADYVRSTAANPAPGTITNASLEPVSGLPYVNPNQVPFTPASAVEVPTIPKTEPGPVETEVDRLLKEITSGQSALSGRTTFTQEKQKEFGVAEAEQAQEDLARQLRDLQREEKAIPLTIQQEFAGRGATRAGVAPIETGRLRENAIKALTLSSSLDAAQGLVASANRKVEKAVAEKYGQQEEDIKIKLANLELLLKSPALDREQKDRALAQQNNLKAQQAVIDEKKKKEDEAQKKVNEILSLNAGKFTSVQEAELRKLPDINAVTSYALNQGLQITKSNILSPTEAARLGVPFGTTESQAAAMGIVPRFGTGEGEGAVQTEIEAWARRINAGTDKISSVPTTIRNKVVAQVKTFAEEDLQEDIQEGLNRNLKKEDLVKQLQTAYPEFSKAEIESLVTGSTPTKAEEKTKQGFIGKVGSFFGSLFR